MIDKIVATTEALVPFPSQGHRRPDLTSRPLRFTTAGNYLIAYAPDEKPLWVIASCHAWEGAVRASWPRSSEVENKPAYKRRVRRPPTLMKLARGSPFSPFWRIGASPAFILGGGFSVFRNPHKTQLSVLWPGCKSVRHSFFANTRRRRCLN